MKSVDVGNLLFSATEAQIQDLFAAHSTVESVRLVTERETGRLRGFGFVAMADGDVGRAIQALNETDLGGRSLRINEAQPKGKRPAQRW